MDDATIERSESGNRIQRYQPRDRDFEFAMGGDEEFLERITSHIDKHVGKKPMVWHEIASDLIHVDIHYVEPTAGRNYHTFVTSGMSDRPMNTPPEAEGRRYAELVVCLPPSWPISDAALQYEVNYWPIRWLKTSARFPHTFDTWLGFAHTLPNYDPPQPYASNTKLCCALLSIPLLFGNDFPVLRVNEKKTIHFLSFIPIYREEMQFKLKHGADPLFERLMARGVTELLDAHRKNTCQKRLFRVF